MPVEINLSPKPKPSPFQYSGGSTINTWRKFDTTLAEGIGYPLKNAWFVGVHDIHGVRKVGVYKRTDNEVFVGGLVVWGETPHGLTTAVKVGAVFTWWRVFFAMEQLPPIPEPQPAPKSKVQPMDASKIIESLKATAPVHTGLDVAKTLAFEQANDASGVWSQIVHTPVPAPVMVKFTVSLQQEKNYWTGKTIALEGGGFMVVGVEKNYEQNTFEITAKKGHA